MYLKWFYLWYLVTKWHYIIILSVSSHVPQAETLEIIPYLFDTHRLFLVELQN